ncbi:hypothetical protein PGQ11_009169 [Apiospora arundinis]|uniref:Uncharacterized protein n=1 Tax=Apiospora arundinis TaxID=335852 RepID=A0ABR2IHA0_9PEZI
MIGDPDIYLATLFPALFSHFFFGLLWILFIAPRIAANREFIKWLNARYDNRSLRKVFLFAVGGLLWELYWLGLILYTVGVRLSSLIPGRRAAKEQQRDSQQNAGYAGLEETTRRPGDIELGNIDGGKVDGISISDGSPPAYRSL